MSEIVARPVPEAARSALERAGVHPVLARLYAARGVDDSALLDPDLRGLLAPDGLRDIELAARLLAEAIDAGRPILIVADYDCDGATACAVAVRGLRMMGARVDYLVPNRFEHGYGLGPAIVELACAHPRLGRPALIVTVDNGIASVEGVARARELGIEVLVTDHHLPGERLPDAAAIVDPNRADCGFASKHLAGVGVMFYVLLALRARLRGMSRFAAGAEPPLQALLDLVALGTVADLVRLDRNNRLLVGAGLRRIRAGQACPGLLALFQAAGRATRTAGCGDLGFAIGPRINAAGRLEDITIGIECLLADDPERAAALAARLDAINRERRGIESDMREQAIADVGAPPPLQRTLVVCRDGWHEGVVGLVASRLKEIHHRPTVAFAPASGEPGMLRGSGRSIPGVHLRDTLDLVSKRHPDMIPRFGGHAMAAGLSLPAGALAAFAEAFEQAILESADPACFERSLLTDGPLAPAELGLELAEAIDRGVWGQGFPAPLFSDVVEVAGQRLVKDRHLKLDLRLAGRRIDAIAFGRTDPLPRRARIAYRLERNDYRGVAELQLVVEAAEPADDAQTPAPL
ncbi:single-stranded-DNA-specific exonuclease RecJ [Quisquiliibacterium transsilvanicum]|uniref:Single-stranded-DNA-specific exonuclease RecJ n=1 Tax=Quisquiliibacterium transsilvanicum TaxID=1549638 RepID=A0A7W8M7R0_9BURK|nr:single-stranded-DNA-specific exonuclease RecJ [Quisquiliibacterium transsilvanicum]MBB5270224.1 single-stranded-DNA-specific exonuclease [Quisquiliibacterium transsilvanicum]